MTIIADAGPLLHLYWIGALEWALPQQQIIVVHQVWLEVEARAPDALLDPRLVQVTEVLAIPRVLQTAALDPGEAAAIAYALREQANDQILVLCDERAARRVCTEGGIPRIVSHVLCGAFVLILHTFG